MTAASHLSCCWIIKEKWRHYKVMTWPQDSLYFLAVCSLVWDQTGLGWCPLVEVEAQSKVVIKLSKFGILKNVLENILFYFICRFICFLWREPDASWAFWQFWQILICRFVSIKVRKLYWCWTSVQLIISLIESLTCNLNKMYKPDIKDRLTASVIMLSVQMKSQDF